MQKIHNSGKVSFSFINHAVREIMVWGFDLDLSSKEKEDKRGNCLRMIQIFYPSFENLF